MFVSRKGHLRSRRYVPELHTANLIRKLTEVGYESLGAFITHRAPESKSFVPADWVLTE